MVPSPKVATYDLQPEMSAPEVTDRLVEAINSKKYNAIICNYANGDMVGHSGILSAAIKAVETLDACVGRVVFAAKSAGAEVIITADHGNAEAMFDHVSNQAHTQHTVNMVPLMYIGRPALLANTGALSDIAPTLLAVMSLLFCWKNSLILKKRSRLPSGFTVNSLCPLTSRAMKCLQQPVLALRPAPFVTNCA